MFSGIPITLGNALIWQSPWHFFEPLGGKYFFVADAKGITRRINLRHNYIGNSEMDKIAESREELGIFLADRTAHAEADGKKLCIISQRSAVSPVFRKNVRMPGMMEWWLLMQLSVILFAPHIGTNLTCVPGRNSSERDTPKTYPSWRTAGRIFVRYQNGWTFRWLKRFW